MSRARGIMLLIVAALVFALYFALLFISRDANFDDAYMFVRYADNLLAGHGYAWNRDHLSTFGCTSIPYTLLITLVRYLFPGIGAAQALTYTSGLFGAFGVALLALACARASEGHPLRSFPVVVVLVAPPLLLDSAFQVHAGTGMDTTLSFFSNALLILALVKFGRWPTPAGAVLAASCSYFTYLVRPDNGIYALVFPAILLLFVYPAARAHVRLFYTTLLALMALDTWVKVSVFGDPLPLSYYVKRSGFYEGYLGVWNPIQYLYEFAFHTGIFWTILILAGRARWRLWVAFLAPMLLTFAYYGSIVQIMGSTFRYYFPSIPFLVAAALMCLDRFLSTVKVRPAAVLRTIAPRVAAAALIVAIALPARGALESAYINSVLARAQASHQEWLRPRTDLPKMDWWSSIQAMNRICQALPRDAVVAATEIGFIGAMNPELEIVDLAGLHDATLAHGGFSMRYVKQRAPAVIWLPHPDYSTMSADLIGDAYFRRSYVLFPGALNHGIAILRTRRDVLDIVKEQLRSIYAASPQRD